MFSKKFTLKAVAAFTLVIAIVSCSKEELSVTSSKTQNAKPHPILLEVYKSPTCGCCKKWVSHINEQGFESKVHNYQNFTAVKEEKGIEPRYRSCHTAISKDGYAFEGHVPAKFIQQFLNEKHDDNVIGLSVPAMPLGSPGMEVGDKFHPYKVLLLKSDGSYEVYSEVQTYEEQF